MEGWWSSHKYSRRSVEEIQTFCGWDYLADLVEKTDNTRDQALIAFLFETGGRVKEVLSLEKRHFRFEGNYIIVLAMPVIKRYEKIDKYQDEEGKTRWVTKRKEGYRTFPIHIKEPLVPYLTDWLEQKDKKLFRIGRVRVYQIITKLEPKIYPHWFRAQRASQLALEYGLTVHELVDFFNWKNLEIAIHYSRMGWKGLATKMVRA